MFTDLVDRANIGMVECRGGTRLTTKAFQRLWVSGNVIGQEFQSDEATKVGILGFINHTHTATAEFLDDAVMRDRLPLKLGRSGHWREW